MPKRYTNICGYHFLVICFCVIAFCNDTKAQSTSLSVNPDSEVPDVKQFAKKYLKRKDLKEYDWQHQNAIRKNDTGALICISILHQKSNENELIYLIAHYKENRNTELLKHVILFKDNKTKMRPYYITSTSFVCKGQSDQEILPKVGDSTLYGSQNACRDCPKPVCTTIKGVYRNNRVENVPPVNYFLIQGAFKSSPASCANKIANKGEWISGWDSIFNPLHKKENH